MGYSAIPCRPGSKRPGELSFKRWYGRNDWQQYCERLPTENETSIWSTWPDAGICVALGRGLIAVDVDTDEPELRQALASVLPQSDVMKRGRKGFTAFYRGSENIRSSAFNVNGERVLDLLAKGKQTVVPPTIHPETGQPYVWIGDPLDRYELDDLPVLPDDIADQIAAVLEPFGYTAPYTPTPTGSGYGNSIWRELNNKALEQLDAWVPALGLYQMERHGQGYRAIADWRESGSGKPTHERGLNLSIHPSGIEDYGDNRKYTPLDLVMAALGVTLDFADNWLREKIGYVDDGMYGLEPWFPPSREVEVVDNIPEEREVTIAPPRGKVNPFTPESAGGLIGEIAEWGLETARRPVPEYAIMAGIAFVAGLYGRRVMTPTGLGVNVYLVGIGTSAHGKSHPLDMLTTLADDCGISQLVVAGEFTSDTAIEKALRRNPSFIVAWDEFGKILNAMNGRNAASWTKTISTALLMLYSQSKGRRTSKGYADTKQEDAGPIYLPTLSVVGMTTPTTFYDGLTESNLSDGFLNRATIVHAKDPPPDNDPDGLIAVPVPIIRQVERAIKNMPSTGNLSPAVWRDAGVKVKPHFVPWREGKGGDAWRRWKEIDQWQTGEVLTNNANEGIIGRASEQTIKYATIRALSRDGADAQVTVDDVEWGWAIVSRSLDSIEIGIQEYMASSEFEALYKAILAALKKAKGGSVPLSYLLRAKGVAKHENKKVMEAIERLEMRGEAVRKKTRGGVQISLVAKIRIDETA